MLLRFDKGTDTAADASGLPGENQVEFPFRHDGKQSVVFSGVVFGVGFFVDSFFCEVEFFPRFL